MDGVQQFEEAMSWLLAGIDERRAAVVTGRPSRRSRPGCRCCSRARSPSGSAGAVADNVAQRVWRRDPSLWGGPGVPEIEDRLGWLTVSETMLEHAAELHAFADKCRAEGYTDAVLLGMGGSSLGPEVIRRSFGDLPGGLRLQVLDSTHPDAVLAVQDSVDLDKTLFIVSSKSGGDDRDAVALPLLQGDGEARAVRRGHRPGQPAERLATTTGCAGAS